MNRKITEFYHGVPCKKAGHTLRYVVGGGCAQCKKKQRDRRYEHKPDQAWKHRIKNKYGITEADYDRMLLEQKGVCKICGSSAGSKLGHFDIDHDHRTGVVRGLLCHACNHGLGNFKDDPLRLELAAVYLRENGRF